MVINYYMVENFEKQLRFPELWKEIMEALETKITNNSEPSLFS